MDANTLATLIIAGTVIFVVGYDRVKRLFFRGAPVEKATQISEETIEQATEEKPLAPRVWLDYVNAQPDRVPHIAIIGPTGSGKTTLTLAVLHDRAGQIIILSGKEGDDWRGLSAIGIDDDLTYNTANRMVNALLEEVKRRNLAAKQHRLTADWLTIVIDDFSTLVKECANAGDLVKLVARIGRSLRIRLIMLSDSALVKSIGLEGEGETRSNFAFIRLKRGHTGTLDIDDRGVPIDATLAPQLASRPIDARRSWAMPRDPNDELSSLLTNSVVLQHPQNAGVHDDSSATLHYATSTTDSIPMPNSGATALPDDDESSMIRNLLQQGFSRNKVAKLLGGSTTTAYKRIHRATGEIEE